MNNELIAFVLILWIAIPINIYLIATNTWGNIANKYWDWKESCKKNKHP